MYLKTVKNKSKLYVIQLEKFFGFSPQLKIYNFSF